MNFSRRQWILAAGAGLVAADSALRVGGEDVEIRVAPVSAHTVRLSVVPAGLGEVPGKGSLVQASWGAPVARLRGAAVAQTVKAGELRIKFTPDPLAFGIETSKGEAVQQVKIDRESGAVSFATGSAPLLGLGEGGPQFDRRGSTDRMRSGQGGYQLGTHGGRVPVPWLIGTNGSAMLIHQPLGTFDFSGSERKFQPATPFPLDLFFVASREPATIMAEYARLTGHAELPPLWSFGYQQSHRTLASRQEILAEAKTFREKKLPCDTLIYLGTALCPSGWNTNNGEFDFNRKVFPDPAAMFQQLHAEQFKVALHVVIRARAMHRTVRDACDARQPVDEQPTFQCDKQPDVFALGVDGGWPDEGDPLNLESRLAGNRR